jgi:hypothetical protein
LTGVLLFFLLLFFKLLRIIVLRLFSYNLAHDAFSQETATLERRVDHFEE